MAKNQNLRFSQISAIRGGLFRLIFTCEPSRPHALGSGAGALLRIQSCGRGCAFSKTSRTDENLVVSGACASVSENSSTDDVLGRRRRPFGLSATREDRNSGAGSAPAVQVHGKQDRGDAAEGRDAGEG